MKHIALFIANALLAAAMPAPAGTTHTERVHFAASKSSATLNGKVTGGDSVLYKLNARKGQFIKVSMTTDKNSADFNVYIPGRVPGDEAWFISATGGREFISKLQNTGDHTISVFLNRNVARKGITAGFKLQVSITDKHPEAGSATKSAASAIPQKVVDDCLAALRKQVGNKPMKVLTKKRGEASYILEVRVEGAQKPWRCFHDGSRCTGTEYQGEG